MAAVMPPASAPTASITRTRSRLTSSATPSTMAMASQAAHACSPSQSMPQPYPVTPRIQGLTGARRWPTAATVARRGAGASPRSETARFVGQHEGHPKRGRQVGLGDHLGQRASSDHLPVAHQHRVREPRRDLLDVVRDQHRGRRRVSPGRGPPGWRPGPRGRRGRDPRRARREAAARGRSSAPWRSAPACARPRSASRRCARPAGSTPTSASSSSARSWSRSS